MSLSSSPSSRDGARTTFCVMDETHWWTLPRLKKAQQTMMANLAKRKIAEPWMLETTTAPEPGAGSVAEDTMDYARAILDGRARDSGLFYFHRQSSDGHDLTTQAGARAAVIEASGSASGWRDIDAIVEAWRDPTTDRSYWERVWCNRRVRSSQKAFDVERWKALAGPSPVKDGDDIALGFDGGMFDDATGLVGTHIKTGYQWAVGLWECPFGVDGWQVPVDEVDDAVHATFSRYHVVRMYADPPYWQSWLSKWAGEFGERVVVEWWTNRRKPMSYALESFETAIRTGSLSHDGAKPLERHIGNAHRKDLVQRDEQGQKLWLIQKERHDSPQKIDLTMAATLSWEARNDSIAAGLGDTPWAPPDEPGEAPPEPASPADREQEDDFIPMGSEIW